MSIEHEIDELIVFLSHPAGFEISVQGQLYLTPDNYNGNYEVKWYSSHEECEEDRVRLEAAQKLSARERRLLGIDLSS